MSLSAFNHGECLCIEVCQIVSNVPFKQLTNIVRYELYHAACVDTDGHDDGPPSMLAKLRRAFARIRYKVHVTMCCAYAICSAIPIPSMAGRQRLAELGGDSFFKEGIV